MQILAEKSRPPSESLKTSLFLRENQKPSVMLCKSKANTDSPVAPETKPAPEGNNMPVLFASTSDWPHTGKALPHKSALVTVEETAPHCGLSGKTTVLLSSATQRAAAHSFTPCFMPATYEAEGPPVTHWYVHVVRHRGLLSDFLFRISFSTVISVFLDESCIIQAFLFTICFIISPLLHSLFFFFFFFCRRSFRTAD